MLGAVIPGVRSKCGTGRASYAAPAPVQHAAPVTVTGVDIYTAHQPLQLEYDAPVQLGEPASNDAATKTLTSVDLDKDNSLHAFSLPRHLSWLDSRCLRFTYWSKNRFSVEPRTLPSQKSLSMFFLQYLCQHTFQEETCRMVTMYTFLHKETPSFFLLHVCSNLSGC